MKRIVISALALVIIGVAGTHQTPKCVDPNANSSLVDCSLISQ